MPHLIERAPTGRAKCRGCGRAIAAGAWRFGERLPNPFADGEGAEMTHWFHPPCAAFKRPEAVLALLAEQPDGLEDAATLRAHAEMGVTHHRLPRVDTAGRAPSGRATCRHCKTTIDKGAWRIGLVYYEDGRFAPSGYIHLACAREYLEDTTDVAERIAHFTPDLAPADLAEIRHAVDAR
jgi:hypothetical protein